MKNRAQWRRCLAGAVLVVSLLAGRTDAFVESTETDGELPTNISGVWLVVTHLEFAKPTPVPEVGAAGAPTPARSPGAAAGAPTRYFNVVSLMRMVHSPKEIAQKIREADKKRQEASIAKAKALIAEEEKKSPPVQTETGEVEGAAKVIVPAVPSLKPPSDGDDVDVFYLDVALPKSIQESIDKASKAETAWVPTDKDLATLKSSWNDLKPSGRDELSKIDWKVIAKDKYDDNLKIDPTTQNAKFTITGNEEMLPKPNVPKTNIVIFGVEDAKSDTLAGQHTRAMMASAPFPLPITMKGKFKMYKLADVPGAGADKAKAPKKPPKS
jgi:hypothetical protein